ncbi:hypothetical protein ASPWEDRAFT_170747 [Aspergillus wentii DTO 134E9]|uniref:PH domain-containing protein n=1 Tax=Aspergillus wentii DTO 134E9 TaxID=1073089 RepID=A0A1L9RQQ5_ASPWE|nr:uncharacterized protein ASPWEDRAFT_170747 [Aspergillus wentii DTO 134E9]KAI9928255.1 hypothetical protein MW887_002288 [Aspergillus wentii]OJJ37261.1 hypothetical protein ASPWEDRAFT_170747 [Aspergillus wentii DTO 134E9]
MDKTLTIPSPSAAEGHPQSPTIQLPDGTIEPPAYLQPIQPPSAFRNGRINLDCFSPVNENGSFEFDRVIKTGKVDRRVKHKHAFRASWKPAYLVLRPNLLSVYKDEEATRLRLSVTLSEVTAIAPVKSHRSNRQHVFGIFSPSKNYRFQASSEKDLEDWIRLIRSETGVEEEEKAILALTKKGETPATTTATTTTTTKKQPVDDTTDFSEIDLPARASSPEFGQTLSPDSRSKRFVYPQDHSANDVTSFSEWSDGPSSSGGIRSKPSINNLSISVPTGRQSSLPRESSRNTDLGILRDPERVIYHGYLQCLRIKGGVKQWKRHWVVLRPKSLGFYKNEQEYSAIKVIPMSQIIEAAEIDPVSRSKKFCLQIIAEEKSYRLCTPDEESLTKWLGSLKSILVARKNLEPTSAKSA